MLSIYKPTTTWIEGCHVAFTIAHVFLNGDIYPMYTAATNLFDINAT